MRFRGAAFNISAMAKWQDPARDEEHIDWARETAAAIEPWSFSGGGYANYMTADEPLERVRAAFGDPAFERLRALKTRYDPRTSCAATRTSHRATTDVSGLKTRRSPDGLLRNPACSRDYRCISGSR